MTTEKKYGWSCWFKGLFVGFCLGVVSFTIVFALPVLLLKWF